MTSSQAAAERIARPEDAVVASHGGVEQIDLVPPVSDSALSLATLRLDARAVAEVTAEDADLLVFVTGGDGSASLAGETLDLESGRALIVRDGETATVTAGGEGLSAARVAVAAEADVHAALGPDERVVALDLDDAGVATSNRSFQVLAGAHNGFPRATVFVGVVPPGAAPWHFHQYDEIVLQLSGGAVYHQSGLVQDVRAGDAVRIRPRLVHVNENPSDGDMLLLGVFTPAGSPSAAYLAADPQTVDR
jgi:quercetin dioxygenase-like cupin family protein